jgi:PAS domain S-box-containing protein
MTNDLNGRNSAVTTPIRILIVEDEFVVAADLKIRLENLGYTVTGQVVSGEQALERITQQDRPDLVLMDIYLKGEKDGIQTAEEIKDQFEIPVVFVSAFADQELLGRAKVAEPFGYVIKPFAMNELRVAVEMALCKSDMESKLKESEKRYRRMAENIHDTLWTLDLDTMKDTYVSPGCRYHIGYEPEELIDTDLRDLITFESREKVAEILAEEISRDSLPGVDPNRIRQIEVEYFHKEGHNVWGEISVSFTRDDQGRPTGILGITRDITDRKLAETALAKSEARLRQITDNMVDLVAQTDLEGRFVYVSPSHQRVLGYAPKDLIGIPVLDLVHPDDMEKVLVATFQAIGDQGEKFVEFRYRHINGHYIWLATQGKILLDDAGEITGAVFGSRDVTKQKEIEAEREQLIEELQKALAEVKTLSGFLPICSHCKKIRDDEGYWQLLETYISERSQAQFSHSLCPECLKELYPEYYKSRS